jgi:predicted amidohydrolase YtcJ
VVDLNGRTMMPGFIDSHSHFGSSAIQFHQPVNIMSHPFGPIDSVKAILVKIKSYIKWKQIPAG